MKREGVGARWLRCDLHVHTPFDGEKKFGADLRGALDAFKKGSPQRVAEIAERFVEACRNAADGRGLDLVALTDHNSIDGYRHLRPQFEALALQAQSTALGMPVILPGVEFSVGGERPLHFLVIFAANTKPDDIDGVIRHVFGPSDRFDPKLGTPRATGQSVQHFIERLYDYCRPANGDRTLEFVLLPAHADNDRGVARETLGAGLSVATTLWDEMKGHLRQRLINRCDWHGFETIHPYEALPQAFKELLWRWAALKRGEDWDDLTEGEKQRYREQRHWPLVECSDPHNYEAIGSRYTWLKMDVPDIEGIRLALLDPESRLRRMAAGPPTPHYSRLERMRVSGTDFFESIEIPLSPSLTTFIGGRGSGKSTLIEYVRHALDRARREDFSGEKTEGIREGVEKILAVKRVQDFGETSGTLLPDYSLEVDVVVADRRYRIRRTGTGVTVVMDPGGEAQQVPLDVRSLIAPRVLSQRQIALIAKEPASQRIELDALLDRDRLQETMEARRRAIEGLSQLQATRSRLKERAKTLPERETELQKVSDQIAFLEQSGRREVLVRFQKLEKERLWIDETLRMLEQQAQALEDAAGAAGRTKNELAAVPSDEPTSSWLSSVSTRIQTRIDRVSATVASESQALRDLGRTIATERIDRWQAGYEQVRIEYTGLRDELRQRGIDFSQHERLLQQRALLIRDVAGIRAIGEELDRVSAEIQAARSSLIQAHERRLELRREQAAKLETLDADVRLEVVPFGARSDFEARRDEWFVRSGVEERDWTVLVDFVFAPGASVPEQINALVSALRSDVNAATESGRGVEQTKSAIARLLGPGGNSKLTGHFYRALENGERLRLDDLERFLPEDAVVARVRKAPREFVPITSGSVGQKSTAILSLLLSAGEEPLIIDQPEDDLDNRYIYDVVVSLLRQRKFSRQIIIATHNANIPVNGDAELIVALGVDNRMGTVLAVGSIDRPDVKENVSYIMEGSPEAFRLRRERYGY